MVKSLLPESFSGEGGGGGSVLKWVEIFKITLCVFYGMNPERIDLNLLSMAES